MKFLYNLVTFLAAVVVLFMFTTHVALNADKLKPFFESMVSFKNDLVCPCNSSECNCNDKNCCKEECPCDSPECLKNK